MASIRKMENKKGISYKIEVSNGYDISGEKMTLEELTEEWLKTYADNHLEKSTYSRYIKIIRQIILPALGHMKLSKIKPYQVESFYISLTKDGVRKDGKEGGYSHGSIRKVRTVLSSILSSAEQWELIESNPCHKATLPKHEEEEKIKCYTAEQTRRFLQFVDEDYSAVRERHTDKNKNIVFINGYATKDVLKMQYKVLFQIALFGGLRRGEMVGLEWNNIDFDSNKIHIKQTANRIEGENIIKSPKTKGSVRSVSLPQPVMEQLREYQQEQNKYRRSLGDKWNGADWLFIQQDGKIMSIGSPYSKFHQLLKKYNKTVSLQEQLPILSLHDLRHTNASLLVHSNRVDTKTVSQKLGHASMATTMKYYIHSYEESEKETAEILEDILIENDVKVAK